MGDAAVWNLRLGMVDLTELVRTLRLGLMDVTELCVLQDEYSIFPQSYTIDVNGYILIYSVTSYKSFEVVRVIHEKLLDMVGNVQVPIILVGNKKDLHMERVISFEEGKALAESWNAAFLESSAKENQTAVEVFRRMILEVEKMEAGQPQGRTPCSVM